eukprot:8492812-Ditylum_brightwellii.AAC.1
MHLTANEGNVSAVKLLVAANASPDIAVKGRRPLHLAAARGFSETVSLLLDAGASVASVTHSGRTPLLCAASRGSETTVKYILKAISNLFKDSGKKDAQEIQSLLDSSEKNTGRTPLSLAAEEGHEEVIQLLLEKGASVVLADRCGRTPIYYAARYGRVGSETIKALATAPRGKETLGWGESLHLRSPLHVAVQYEHTEIVRALLECGADPNLVDNDACSSLHEAMHYNSYGYGRHRDKQKLRISASDNQDEKEENEEEKQRLEILQLLLKTGQCHLNQGEVHGCTPLWYAARGGWTKAVEMLLNAGACVDPGDLPHLPDKKRG